MAEALGSLLADHVEVIGFDELLKSLNPDHGIAPRWFNCAQIDGMLQNITSKRTSPPVLELVSLGSGAGKTHLLYLLISLAVLSPKYGGKGGTAVVVDTDGHFSIDRLAKQIQHRLTTWTSNLDKASIASIVRSALYHVYLYKPQSMRDLVETLNSLPDYFLRHNHYSLDRCMSFVAIDSASAYYWQTRAEEENASFTAGMQSSAGTTARPVGFADLRNAMEVVSKSLQCPIVITTRHVGRLPKTVANELPRVLRPSLPSPLAQLSTLRLVVRRVPVKKLPSGLNSVELARENVDRMKIVALSRFECFVDESGLNLRNVQTLRATQDGFYFRIKAEGVVIETPQSGDDEGER